MSTKFINVKDWRQNMMKYWKESREKRVRYIVMKHSRPIFEVSPIHQQNFETKAKSIEAKKVGKSFEFWFSDEDDNIFDESVLK